MLPISVYVCDVWGRQGGQTEGNLQLPWYQSLVICLLFYVNKPLVQQNYLRIITSKAGLQTRLLIHLLEVQTDRLYLILRQSKPTGQIFSIRRRWLWKVMLGTYAMKRENACAHFPARWRTLCTCFQQFNGLWRAFQPSLGGNHGEISLSIFIEVGHLALPISFLP